MCTCMQEHMWWLKVLLAGMIKYASCWSCGHQPFLKCCMVALASVYTGCSQLRACEFRGTRPSCQLWNLLQVVSHGSPFFLNSPHQVSLLQHAVLSSCVCSSPELLTHLFLFNVPPQPPSCRLQQVNMCLWLYLHPALSDMCARRLEALEAASGAGGDCALTPPLPVARILV